MLIYLHEHLVDGYEITVVAPLRDRIYLVARIIEQIAHAVLFGVCALGDIFTRLDKTAQQTFFLDYLRIVADVQRRRHAVYQHSDIILSARLVVHTVAHKIVYQRYDVDLTARRKQPQHCRKYLLMLGDVKIAVRHRIGDISYRFGVDEHRTEQRLLRYHRKRHFFGDIVIHEFTPEKNLRRRRRERKTQSAYFLQTRMLTLPSMSP